MKYQFLHIPNPPCWNRPLLTLQLHTFSLPCFCDHCCLSKIFCYITSCQKSHSRWPYKLGVTLRNFLLLLPKSNLWTCKTVRPLWWYLYSQLNPSLGWRAWSGRETGPVIPSACTPAMPPGRKTFSNDRCRGWYSPTKGRNKEWPTPSSLPGKMSTWEVYILRWES